MEDLGLGLGLGLVRLLGVLWMKELGGKGKSQIVEEKAYIYLVQLVSL